ncbi:N-acetylglucosaminyl-diphospho-decaprenol L-rhamnosyltransferase [Abditibacteriota bacterium]|nr:N-acetylglucosaminyl-diphospho-decaprenol L-rhamnosyltransferase [Abditibacteriota bacterium]
MVFSDSASAVSSSATKSHDGQVLVSVVIVSFNTRETTLHCLRDLEGELERLSGESEVFVVDNDSKDGSAEAIRREFPSVRLLELDSNEGFGPANNRAFAEARGEFLLLLNSDAFVHPGALETLVGFLQAPENARVGGVGPKLLNEDGSLQASCWKFPSPGRSWIEALGLARIFASHPKLGDYYRWAHDETRGVDFVIGACLLMRREVYEEVGGFDPAFFLYAEETDWQKRMLMHGWTIAFCPDAVVTHLGGVSGAADSNKTSTLFWQGQERFMQKHFGSRGWLLFRGALFVGALTRFLALATLALHPRKRQSSRTRLRFFAWQMGRLLSTRAPAPLRETRSDANN